jgi:hypothetical protein
MIIFKNARVYFIEVKRPKNFKVSKLQEYNLDLLSSYGFNTLIVHTYEEVDKFIKGIEN